MDVVWLKRDVRLHDHGPFAEVAKANNPFLILYLWEPDQLSESSVHGSHLQFINEGLVDLDRRLSASRHGHDESESSTSSFHSITICHKTLIETLEEIHHQHHKIGRILAHEETGNWESFMRDKAARKWCRVNNITLLEFNQTGVTRCLKQREDYSKQFKAFMARPRWPTPCVNELQKRLVVLNNELSSSVPSTELDLTVFTEMSAEHRVDRPQRQQHGGETKAMSTSNSFFQERGSTYSLRISSPNTSWTSCSRLSTYLSWGHISLRLLLHTLQEKQEHLRNKKKHGVNTGPWLRSLQAFSSRLHWRSHFIQKLESEPLLEKQDLCRAYQHLRRQDGDWNEEFYQAWKTGRTGFPFVDACMRCLEAHGWLNFRMRAMVVSFATYNLWLDWKRIAPHLARVFLDYEPGIHYPQLQMQSGCTGINAMRVYSVTKQSKDQDAHGTFIRKHIPELRNVPTEYIHEPWKMPLSVQQRHHFFLETGTAPSLQKTSRKMNIIYPMPIVNEQESAKVAKAKVAAIRKLDSTKQLAEKVYQNHGSRNRTRDEMNGKKPKALSNVVEKEDPAKQPKISSMFRSRAASKNEAKARAQDPNEKSISKQQKRKETTEERGVVDVDGSNISAPGTKRKKFQTNVASINEQSPEGKKRKAPTIPESSSSAWSCKKCTFLNDKPLGLQCSICATPRMN
jgi:deoxyribodipyrimidine photo-lyase